MVSVIIVSWNTRDILLQCLDSLSEQACRYAMEIIVVDNASSDGSAEAVAKSHPHVRLIRNTENLGFAKANNQGICVGAGRYFCLVNSDVKVLPNCITQLVDYCEQHQGVGMVGPRIVGGDGLLQRSCRGFPTVWNMFCRALALDTLTKKKLFSGYALLHSAQDFLGAVDILTGCFWLVRRDALMQVGGLDENFFMYGEDMDWCKRFWNQGWHLVFFPKAEAIHYGGASSSNAPVRFYIERQKADLQYWKKHHSTLGMACFFSISCLHQLLRATGYFVAGFLRPKSRETYRNKINRSVACLKWLLSPNP